MSSFVVANGLNTSYIDSLLMALFYKQSHLRSFLNQYPEQSKFLYLQELINDNFIYNAKHGYSVDSSIINEIRNYSIVCGWKDSGNITDLYSVTDYLKFLMDGIGFGQIDFEFVECNEIDGEKVKSISVNYIDTTINEHTDTKILLENWYDSHVKTKSDNHDKHIKLLILCRRFKEIPFIIPIYFSRTQGSIYQVDIKKRIKFKKNSDTTQNKTSWIIHSLICFSNSGGGNYYSVINTEDNQWFMFTNDKLPSLIKITISDPDISNRLKQECILAIYRLD